MQEPNETRGGNVATKTYGMYKDGTEQDLNKKNG